MGWSVQPLLVLLARCSRHRLIQQIEFLKAENEMLRKRVPKQKIWLKPDEKARLVQLANGIGPELKQLVSIVSYVTFCSWRRKAGNRKPRVSTRYNRKPDEIRALVVKIARETGWGYTRILGELRKLGIKKISRQTVVNILKQSGHNPYAPKGPGTWDELLKRHADTLWQCDFFSKRVISRLAFPQLYAMVLLNVATRRVWVSSTTKNPTEAWVMEQAEAFTVYVEANDLRCEMVTRDNDQVYKQGFDELMEGAGIRVKRLALRSPNTNAYVERFIQPMQVECLDHFLVFGEKHFDYLVKEYVDHYHTERPHQGIGNKLISGEPPPCPSNKTAELRCRSRLGGLLKHYSRWAA